MSMRAALALMVVGLALAACGGDDTRTIVVPQPAPTVVVPQGASVVCPSGAPAVYSGGAYRC
jgi:hypothetical protein